ncbi:MAG: SRPBCC family protein [Geodermatophilaceae bacterium]|nr:SRPBCC family protein [Geodermatophilaceae bacterium]MDQ3454776.1 SRPBCC family protein [Actinomycetota bacterium]
MPDASNRKLFDRTVGCATIEIACPAADAWALVADVTRMGEFSPECVGARWIGLNRGAHVGARFEGTNRARTATGDLIWVRPCTVVVADSGRSFGFVVGDRYDGTPATHWLYEFASKAPGTCRVTVTFSHLPDGLSGLRLVADSDLENAANLVAGRLRELTEGMQTTLGRMKAVLEN